MKFDGQQEDADSDDEDNKKFKFYPPNSDQFFKNDQLGYKNIEIFAGEKGTKGN